jgi:S1-C subfamily serine protease
LYLKESVIGVNTQKLAAVNVQGLGFAVHYSEVLTFLRENKVEVRVEGK